MATSRQVLVWKVGEKDTVEVDCIGVLSPGQKLTGAPTVTIVPSEDAPELSDKFINTEELPAIVGPETSFRAVPESEAVMFFVDTTAAAPRSYTITVTAQKTGTPEPTRIADLILKVTP